MALCFLTDLASHNLSDLLFTSLCTYILPNMRLMATRHEYTNLSHLFCGTDGPISITEQFVQLFQVKYLSWRGLLFHRIKLQISVQKLRETGPSFAESSCNFSFTVFSENDNSNLWHHEVPNCAFLQQVDKLALEAKEYEN